LITCGFLPIFIELSTNCPQIRTVIHNFGQMTCIMVSPYSDTLSSLLVCPYSDTLSGLLVCPCFRHTVRLIGLSLFSALCPTYWSVPVSDSLSGLLVCPCSDTLSGLLVCPCFRLPVQFINLSHFQTNFHIFPSKIHILIS